MLKARLKSNGRESLIIGLTPEDLAELLSDGIMLVEGADYGLEDRMIVLMVGQSSGEMVGRLEAHLPVKFPRDDQGNYLPVNS